MLSIKDLRLGYNDAENYLRRENKELFNKIFYKNNYLESLLSQDRFFLIGDKGTGKTAYATFLTNNKYKKTNSSIKYIRETEYQKFLFLKNNHNLDLSDYTNIWTVILLVLISGTISFDDIDHILPTRICKFRAIKKSIDDYYKKAFSPEIIYALNYVVDSKKNAEILSENLKAGVEKSSTQSYSESKFQVNLLYLEQQFKESLSTLKLKENFLLLIDGIDTRPSSIPYADYLQCIKGLANATWNLNNDFFPNIRDSHGRVRIVLLLRPDIFNSLELPNSTNKIRDNGVFLDWNTSYKDYENSHLFTLSDKILKVQQDIDLPVGETWNSYFPWTLKSTNIQTRPYDTPFMHLLSISYSKPRDIISLLGIMQSEMLRHNCGNDFVFSKETLLSPDFMRKFSDFLLGEIKDQLSFYYDGYDYDNFLRFFMYLDGKNKFDYGEYLIAHEKYVAFLNSNQIKPPKFIEFHDGFLQFLYDINIIAYAEDTEDSPFYRYCYKERSPAIISPKVKFNSRYIVHKGLLKALNLGNTKLLSANG